jgi:hypothetical protein
VTQVNRKSRTMVRTGTCTICGREDETRYHAVIRCPKAKALRRELRKHWALPDEDHFVCTGPDWLLVPLLSRLDAETKAKVLLFFGELGTYVMMSFMEMFRGQWWVLLYFWSAMLNHFDWQRGRARHHGGKG